MKKLFAILLVLPLLWLSQSSFLPGEYKGTTITIKRSGAGSTVYNLIKEHHNGNVQTLKCSDAGFDKGDWTILPKLGFCEKSVPDIEAAVQEMMRSTKAVAGDIAYTRTVVEWKGTKDSYTITIREE